MVMSHLVSGEVQSRKRNRHKEKFWATSREICGDEVGGGGDEVPETYPGLAHSSICCL